MAKTLTPIGNSLGLIIDKPILHLLGIDRDTRLDMSVTPDGKGIEVRAIGAEGHRDRVRRSNKRMAETHRAALKKLAE